MSSNLKATELPTKNYKHELADMIKEKHLLQMNLESTDQERLECLKQKAENDSFHWDTWATGLFLGVVGTLIIVERH